MSNENKNKRNQPPSGEGKKQGAHSGAAHKLSKRSEVTQAQRNRPERNAGTSADETASGSAAPLERSNPDRPKAGR